MFDNVKEENPYLRPCVCTEEEPVDNPRSYCYVEGTDLDKSTSDNVEELGENVWFESKPPRLFKTDIKPLITARQIQVSRVLMNGGRMRIIGVEDNFEPCKEKILPKIKKKRDANRTLSTTVVEED